MEYVLIIIGILVIGVFGFINEVNRENKARANRQRNPDFHPDITLYGFGNEYLFEVDKIKKLTRYTRGRNKLIIPFKNFINADLSQDGNNSSHTASYIKIYITLRNMDITTLTIDCYHVPFSMQVSTKGLYGIQYRESLEKAQQLINFIKYIIDDNQKDQQTSSSISSLSQKSSSLYIADELQKLHNLKSEGILTDEEFESQKQKLLSQ